MILQAIIWVVMRHRLVCHLRFGTAFRSHLKGSGCTYKKKVGKQVDLCIYRKVCDWRLPRRICVGGVGGNRGGIRSVD